MENQKPRIIEETAVTITVEDGAITFYEKRYGTSPKLLIKTDGPIHMTTSLSRHIRILSDIFGYDNVKSSIDNFPQELKKSEVAE